MKKTLLGILFIGIGSSLYAQDAADKKVQAGLVFGAGMNIQKMETKRMFSPGLGSTLTIGANVNYTFNETVGINIGVEFDFETLKYTPGDSPVYYYYNIDDNAILSQAEAIEDGADQLFQLTERKQKPIYLTIPTMALFRTKFIGYFRYFGKFGLRSSFLLSNKISDDGFNYPEDANPVTEIAVTGKNENMETSKNDLDFFKSSVGLVGGAEWNFSGSTSLVAEIGYYYGFTNFHRERKDDKRALFTTDALGQNPEFFNNAASQSQILFKLSILF